MAALDCVRACYAVQPSARETMVIHKFIFSLPRANDLNGIKCKYVKSTTEYEDIYLHASQGLPTQDREYTFNQGSYLDGSLVIGAQVCSHFGFRSV